MQALKLSRGVLLLAFLATPLVGCDGSGTTQDTKPTAPVITAESGKDLAKSINSQKGDMKPVPKPGQK